ncbi:hypothetical protein BDN72DRAFT_664554 [Pluteus cervinus]|uniref:Uncharacterized protein n=1 Tax=Pluteus cervinus TaxID=181527 RepID=A0ACD3B9Q8_9AGAR|nr:hypothetical protein BDN72DRAFT_664554 [Pluteus cervinus]
MLFSWTPCHVLQPTAHIADEDEQLIRQEDLEFKPIARCLPQFPCSTSTRRSNQRTRCLKLRPSHQRQSISSSVRLIVGRSSAFPIDIETLLRRRIDGRRCSSPLASTSTPTLLRIRHPQFQHVYCFWLFSISLQLLYIGCTMHSTVRGIINRSNQLDKGD